MVGERRCSGKEFQVLGAATRKLRLPNSVQNVFRAFMHVMDCSCAPILRFFSAASDGATANRQIPDRRAHIAYEKLKRMSPTECYWQEISPYLTGRCRQISTAWSYYSKDLFCWCLAHKLRYLLPGPKERCDGWAAEVGPWPHPEPTQTHCPILSTTNKARRRNGGVQCRVIGSCTTSRWWCKVCPSWMLFISLSCTV